MPTKNYYVNLDDSRNQFSFVCPIFEVTTKISMCFKLRELFWAGAKPDVRKGCQACMRANKCPAAAIVSQRRQPGRSWQDDYASDEPVVGKIRRDILERIHRPMVVEAHYREFPVSDAERLKIETASDRIGKMIGAAPLPSDDGAYVRPTFSGDSSSATKKRRVTKPKADNTNSVSEAAKSGDLAAAINAA
ncbi:hypothetical protein IB265_33410 [Ensifer sp. ENS10]|uniref:hypothetical protein n=1 Tax=Ensifer sp. ENS10 TaxID=2769286 RepID=UPI0017866D9F|nr:hypothetical protein [Ensifer sp. ENS10]MBD9511656.1 hypothetical protein [Ensifer sp. ENS10]